MGAKPPALTGLLMLPSKHADFCIANAKLQASARTSDDRSNNELGNQTRDHVALSKRASTCLAVKRWIGDQVGIP